jgi:hypothetical protein
MARKYLNVLYFAVSRWLSTETVRFLRCVSCLNGDLLLWRSLVPGYRTCFADRLACQILILVSDRAITVMVVLWR